MAFTRISITLPRDVLAAADRRARALDRSRSWLIVEAIRAYLAGSPSQVREPAASHSLLRSVRGLRRLEAEGARVAVKHYDTRVAGVCARLNQHRAKYLIVG